MKQLSLFRWSYYLLVSDDNSYFWDGKQWTRTQWEAKHYLFHYYAKIAQNTLLRYNKEFKSKPSKIIAIFKI